MNLSAKSTSQRHLAGLFSNKAARQAAEEEFISVIEDAGNQKKKIDLLQQRTKEQAEKRKLMEREQELQLEEAKRKMANSGKVEFDLSELMEEEIEDYEREKRQKESVENVKKYFARKMEALSKSFIDYGPPYNDEDVLGGLNLVAQSANYPPKLIEMHNLLNKRVNPNTKDPDDLHYAAAHWCARNFSVIGLKMLRKACADLNVTNELGQTPVTLCVIVSQTDRRKYQLKALKYLIDERVDLNTRDKAGYGPIDYAAMNQDAEIFQILASAGSKIIRTNADLVAPRESTLQHVKDPDCYRVVLEQYEREMEVISQNNELELAAKLARAEKARIKKLHKDLAKKRDNRLEGVRLAAINSKTSAIRDQRRSKLAQEDKEERARLAERLQKFGEWKKVEESKTWVWEQKKSYENREFQHLYVMAKEQMQGLRDANCFQKFDARWHAVTGTHLEVPWARGEGFAVEGIDNSKAIAVDAAAGGSVDQTSVLFRDENDQELEGEDLNDLLGSLKLSS